MRQNVEVSLRISIGNIVKSQGGGVMCVGGHVEDMLLFCFVFTRDDKNLSRKKQRNGSSSQKKARLYALRC